jgi:hypothetical protein
MRVWQITYSGFISLIGKCGIKQYAETTNCVSFTPFESPVMPMVKRAARYCVLLLKDDGNVFRV